MSPRNSRKSPPVPPSDPAEPRDPVEPIEPPGNGAHAEETEAETMVATEEEPAQVQLTIKGSDKSARAAAKRFGEGAGPKHPPMIETPGNEPEEPPDDPIALLLADGKNMVIVTRQTPRNIRGPRGEKIVTNVRMPGKYTCPTSIAAIEDQVFGEHGGSTYKCTIHPDTSTGENTILGHFKIEHPDPSAAPYIEGVTDVEPENVESEIPTRGDPTMHETDTLAALKENLQRRLERAQIAREIKELERQVREFEGSDRPPTPPAESDEVKKLREENERLRREAEAKKTDDRFNALQDSITKLAQSVTALTTARPSGGDENSIVKTLMQSQKEMFTQAQQHSKEMLEVVKSMSRPAAGTPSNEDAFDKAIDRLTKVQGILGKKDDRMVELQERAMDALFDKLSGGEDDRAPADEEDAFKFALKQMTPVIKAYVEKKVDNRGDDAPPVSKEELKRAYEEAGARAAKEVAEKWQREGLVVKVDPKTGQPHGLPAPDRRVVVPPRGTPKPAQRVTPEGVTRTVHVQPTDLSKKAPPVKTAGIPEPKKGETVAKFTELPGLGPDGGVLKVELPAQPGDMKYDRRKALDFVLDSIRSEIRQEVPTKSPDDTVVPGDALEMLDHEMLDLISDVDSADALEKVIGPFCDGSKLAEVKEAGKIETNASWLRRVFLTIRDHWRDFKKSGGK